MHRQSHSRTRALHRVLMIAMGSVLFVLAPLGSASAYTEKVLHSFCAEQACGDGEGPQARPMAQARMGPAARCSNSSRNIFDKENNHA